MTPAQQEALETLVERPLTQNEIDAISSLLPLRNDVAIASILSTGRVKIQSKPIGIGTILMAMAPNGGLFLDTLETLGATDPNIKWALKLIEKGEFDVGLDGTRSQLQAYSVAMPEISAGISALLALAEVPSPIHYNSVSDALNKV